MILLDEVYLGVLLPGKHELVMPAGDKQFSFSSSGLLKRSSTCFNNPASLRAADLLQEGLSE